MKEAELIVFPHLGEPVRGKLLLVTEKSVFIETEHDTETLFRREDIDIYTLQPFIVEVINSVASESVVEPPAPKEERVYTPKEAAKKLKVTEAKIRIACGQLASAKTKGINKVGRIWQIKESALSKVEDVAVRDKKIVNPYDDSLFDNTYRPEHDDDYKATLTYEEAMETYNWDPCGFGVGPLNEHGEAIYYSNTKKKNVGKTEKFTSMHNARLTSVCGTVSGRRGTTKELDKDAPILAAVNREWLRRGFNFKVGPVPTNGEEASKIIDAMSMFHLGPSCGISDNDTVWDEIQNG